MERPRRIVLVGIMGAGKTTIGRLLADRLRWKHIDLDRRIEARAGRSIPDIFRTSGEQAFRTLEAEASAEVIDTSEAVLSTGGGWPTNPAIAFPPAGDTLSIWLRASPDEVVRRLHDGGVAARPMLACDPPRDRLEALLAARAEVYARADMTVETTGRSPNEIVNELLPIILRYD